MELKLWHVVVAVGGLALGAAALHAAGGPDEDEAAPKGKKRDPKAGDRADKVAPKGGGGAPAAKPAEAPAKPAAKVLVDATPIAKSDPNVPSEDVPPGFADDDLVSHPAAVGTGPTTYVSEAKLASGKTVAGTVFGFGSLDGKLTVGLTGKDGKQYDFPAGQVKKTGATDPKLGGTDASATTDDAGHAVAPAAAAPMPVGTVRVSHVSHKPGATVTTILGHGQHAVDWLVGADGKTCTSTTLPRPATEADKAKAHADHPAKAPKAGATQGPQGPQAGRAAPAAAPAPAAAGNPLAGLVGAAAPALAKGVAGLLPAATEAVGDVAGDIAGAIGDL